MHWGTNKKKSWNIKTHSTNPIFAKVKKKKGKTKTSDKSKKENIQIFSSPQKEFLFLIY